MPLRNTISEQAWKRLHKLRGDDSLTYAEQLERQQWLGAAEMRAWHEEQMLGLLEYAYDQSEFHRPRIEKAFGGRPSRERIDDGFARLPILTKDEVRRDARRMLTGNIEELLTARTSGSTGIPVQVWKERCYVGYLQALQRRALNWYGVEPWSPTFYYGGPMHTVSGRVKQKMLDVVIGRLIRVSHDMSPAALDRVMRRVRQFRPHLITGYTSALYYLARHCEEVGVAMNDLGVRLVMPVSEQVQPFHEETLRKVFGAPIMQEYGCVEIGAMAYTCPAGKMHISHEHVRLEIVDPEGRPVLPGQTGRVILTPLGHRAMPLLRYEIGDLAQFDTEACPCGRYPGLPLLKGVMGRSMDHVVDRQGHTWNAMLFFYAFKFVFNPAVFREFQGSQTEPGKVHIAIVPGQQFTDADGDRFAAAVATEMQQRIDITWNKVERIERDASGKLKYFKGLSTNACPPAGGG